MVSFQCEGCGDVVKKPKLDNHRSSCHSPFTCIDCSTTFNGPAEYKSHTQCISEAEKYQKGLYKGSKGSQNQNGPQNNNPRNNFNDRGQQNGTRTSAPSGKYPSWGNNGAGGARQPWGTMTYQRYEGTGANASPLGTPARMSPVATPATPDDDWKKPEYTKLAAAEVRKPVNGAAQPTEEKKSKKDKKRKSEAGQSEDAPEPRKKKAKTESDVMNPVIESPGQTVDKKEKKSKKSKRKESAETREEEAKAEKDEVETEAAASVEVGGKEKKKKKKKSKDATLGDVSADAELPATAIKSAEAKSPAKEKSEKKKKVKKDKKHKKFNSDIGAADS